MYNQISREFDIILARIGGGLDIKEQVGIW